MENNQKDSAFVNDTSIYGKPIKAIPKPTENIGIDTDNEFIDNIIEAGESSQIDLSAINNFTSVAQSREQMYQLFDTMRQDPLIAAILETYAEDATEYNDSGRIMWVESSDADISAYVTYLLDTCNIDKHIYQWAYNLCAYGDTYLHLFRESEYSEDIFDNVNSKDSILKDKNKADILNEEINVRAYKKSDKFVHYLEMMPNPAEMFELTRFGKTSGYVKAEVNNTIQENQYTSFQRYRFNRQDIDLYPATAFVHATLDDNSSRKPEQVEIFIDRQDAIKDSQSVNYSVRRGLPLLYNSYKIWRQLTLLENSVMLNRLTKSSIIRMINVEVGDMPKDKVQPHLRKVKQLIEQKSALNASVNLSEYNNPGPVENTVYIPTHNGVGNLTTQEVGGNVDVKGLADLDYFKNRLFGSARVPKQFFGDTDDGAGFNGGESLSQISSRYAKMIKRIQNSLIQMVTDAFNLYLLDKDLGNYINKFTLHMQPPATLEERTRQENKANKVGLIGDIQNILSDIENPVAKLKITKSLLSTVVDDPEVFDIIEQEIKKMQDQIDSSVPIDDLSKDNDLDLGSDISSSAEGSDYSFGSEPLDMDTSAPTDLEEPEESPDTVLPSPDQLGVDLTDNNSEI